MTGLINFPTICTNLKRRLNRGLSPSKNIQNKLTPYILFLFFYSSVLLYNTPFALTQNKRNISPKQESKIEYVIDSSIEWAKKINEKNNTKIFFEPVNNELKKQGIGRLDPQYHKIKIKDWKSLDAILEGHIFGCYDVLTGQTAITDEYGHLFSQLIWIHESAHEDFFINPKRTEILFQKINFNEKKEKERIVALPINGRGLKPFLIIKNKQQSNSPYAIYSIDGSFITTLDFKKGNKKNSLTGIAQIGGIIGEFDFDPLNQELVFKPSPTILHLYSEVMAPIDCEIATGNLQAIISTEELKKKNPELKKVVEDQFPTGLSLEIMVGEYHSQIKDMRLQLKDIYEHIGHNTAFLVEETLKDNWVTFDQMLKEVSGILVIYLPNKNKEYIQVLDLSGKNKEFELRLALESALRPDSIKDFIQLYCEKGPEAFIEATEKDLIIYRGKVLDEMGLAKKYLQNSFMIGPYRLSEKDAEHIINKINPKTFEEVVKDRNKIKYIEELKHKHWINAHKVTPDDSVHWGSVLELYKK